MFHLLRNTGYSETPTTMRTPSTPPQEPRTPGDLVSLVTSVLTERLPGDWTIQPTGGEGARLRHGPDLIIDMTAPDGTQTRFVVEAKRKLDAPQARAAADELDRTLRELADDGVAAYGVVVAPYISAANQDRLADHGLGFVDATGNVRLACDRPAIFIQSAGSDRNPWPRPSELQSLKGRAAGTAVRALVDFVPPYGIRQLAERAQVSAPTLSRVVDLLDREGLVERTSRGPVQALDWEGAIRRWVLDYGVTDTNSVAMYLAPRGPEDVANQLREYEGLYAMTGSMALPREVSIAPVRLAMIYTHAPPALGSYLGLRRVDGGANVLLIEPFDDVVFARTGRRHDLVSVAVSQLAADLLTGPGRAPSEGDELMTWMKAHEDAWRARP